jgi:hypothetical protein
MPQLFIDGVIDGQSGGISLSGEAEKQKTGKTWPSIKTHPFWNDRVREPLMEMAWIDVCVWQSWEGSRVSDTKAACEVRASTVCPAFFCGCRGCLARAVTGSAQRFRMNAIAS